MSVPNVTDYFPPSGGLPLKVQTKPVRTRKDSHFDWDFDIALICCEDDEPITVKIRTILHCYLNTNKMKEQSLRVLLQLEENNDTENNETAYKDLEEQQEIDRANLQNLHPREYMKRSWGILVPS
eukprot:579831-Ditylum_brightwellii.AAC.1